MTTILLRTLVSSVLCAGALWSVPQAEAQQPNAQNEPREVRVLRQKHTYSRVVYSLDGALIAAAGDDFSIKIWDAKTRKLRTTIAGNAKRIVYMDFSPDSTLLATTNGMGVGEAPRIYDVKTGKVTALLKDEKGVSKAAFGADGKTLIGLDGRKVRVWDSATGKLVHTFENCYDFALSADRQTLASKAYQLAGPGLDRTVFNVWNLKTGKLTATLNGLYKSEQYYALSRDGKLLAHCDLGISVFIWDIAAGEIKKTIPIALPAGVQSIRTSPECVAFSSGGKIMTLGMYSVENSTTNQLRLFDVEAGKEVAAISGLDGLLGSVAFHPDGRTLAIATKGGPIKLWDVGTSKMLAGLEEPDTHFAGDLHSLALSPDGKILAAGHGSMNLALQSASVTLWEAATGKEIAVLQRPQKGKAVAFSPDSKSVVCVGMPATSLMVLDVQAKKEKALSTGKKAFDEATASAVVFSGDGKLVASAAAQRPGFLKKIKTGFVEILLFDTADWTFKRIAGGELPRTRTAPPFIPLAVTVDSKKLAFQGMANAVTLWDLSAEKELATMVGHTATIHTLAFSPNGKMLASAGSDKTVRLWDLATNKEIAVIEGHTEAVNALAFSPDSKTLVSASDDNTLKLWDVATRKEIATMRGHAAAVHCVAYNSDGRTVASGGKDNTIRIWDVSFRVK